MNKYKKAKLIFWGGLILGGLVCLVGESTNPVLFLIGGAILVVTCIYENINYRCPSCDTHFDIRAETPDFCPKCGQKL